MILQFIACNACNVVSWNIEHYFFVLDTTSKYLFCTLQAFFFVGVVVISYAAAFIVSVCVEFPMMQLEKLIFKSDHWALKVKQLRSVFL